MPPDLSAFDGLLDPTVLARLPFTIAATVFVTGQVKRMWPIDGWANVIGTAISAALVTAFFTPYLSAGQWQQAGETAVVTFAVASKGYEEVVSRLPKTRRRHAAQHTHAGPSETPAEHRGER